MGREAPEHLFYATMLRDVFRRLANPARASAAPVDLADLLEAIALLQDQRVESGTPEIDDVSASTQARCALDERRLKLMSLDPKRQARPRNAAAENENLHHE